MESNKKTKAKRWSNWKMQEKPLVDLKFKKTDNPNPKKMNQMKMTTETKTKLNLIWKGTVKKKPKSKSNMNPNLLKVTKSGKYGKERICG